MARATSGRVTFTVACLPHEALYSVDAIATRRRDNILHTFGNLTILTQPLNSSLSKGSWEKKRPAIIETSLLPINLRLQQYDAREETTIDERAKELLTLALNIWPRPTP